MSIQGGERRRGDGGCDDEGGAAPRASAGRGAEAGPEAAFCGHQHAVTRALAAGEVTERVREQLAGDAQARRARGGGLARWAGPGLRTQAAATSSAELRAPVPADAPDAGPLLRSEAVLSARTPNLAGCRSALAVRRRP